MKNLRSTFRRALRVKTSAHVISAGIVSLLGTSAACNTARDVPESKTAQEDVVGFQLMGAEEVPTVEVAVQLKPTLEPIKVVQPFSQAIADSLRACSGTIKENGFGPMLSLEFRYQGKTLTPTRTNLPGVAGCVSSELHKKPLTLATDESRFALIQIRPH